MNGLSLLAPLPVEHIEAALTVSSNKEFVLLGSESYDILKDVDIGSPVYIYVSHDDRSSVEYVGTFLGVVGDLSEMRRLEVAGFRPNTTADEKWGFYWKLKGLAKLAKPVPLSQIQLPSKKCLRGVPHGPMLIAG
jgi:hypothetical protein